MLYYMIKPYVTYERLRSMVFSSMLFVFLFLAANLLTQYLIKDVRKKNIVMLAFSLVFYGWAGPRYLLLLLLMVAICWIGALMTERNREKTRRKRAMILTVAACLVILGIFKYLGFLLGTLKAVIGVPEVVPKIVLPIGISFYTFQLISYVVDVYRGEVEAQRQYWKLLLYASLFHQCIAGPIVRYKDVAMDLEARKMTLKETSAGISRFTVGLAKKAILANGCAAIADLPRRNGGYAGQSTGDGHPSRHVRVYAADLSRFFRLLRHGNRHGTHVRPPL